MPVTWGYENDMIRGIGAGYFAPSRALNRQELSAMMYRFAERQGYDVRTPAHITVTGVESWAIDYVRWAVYRGFIAAENPAQIASRAETAYMLMRFSNWRG